MLMDGNLRKHIVGTDKQVKERFEMLMKQILDSCKQLFYNVRKIYKDWERYYE